MSDSKSQLVDRKFTSVKPVSGWSVETSTGFQPISSFNTTVPYDVWRATTDGGSTISAADDHIFITDTGEEVFLKDSLGVELHGQGGASKVVSVEKLDRQEPMYDLTVDSVDHTYYTNGLLSHNTTVAAGYLLWYAMFVEDSTILIASNKYDAAQEIMLRVRFAYESVPDHIRAGVKTYNKRSIDFDNGSRIVSTATTENTGRGMSLSLIYCLGGENTVTVRDRETGEVKEISLSQLHSELGS